MGKELLSKFHLERKRLFCLIGVTVAMIFAFQYLEFPYGDDQPIFSPNRIPTPDSIEMFKNMVILNQANSTGENAREIINETRTPEGKGTVSSTGFISEPVRESNRSLGFDETDESSIVESVGLISNNGSVTEQAGNLGLSSYNTISHSPSHAVILTNLAPSLSPTDVSPNITPPVLSNDYEETDFAEDERFRPSQDDVNILGHNSSINNAPKETKEITISEMKELLLQNRASYHSMVNDLIPPFSIYMTYYHIFFEFYSIVANLFLEAKVVCGC